MKLKLVYLLSLFIISFSSNEANAQFGARIKYNQNKHANWDNLLRESFNTKEEYLASGYEVGLDYWFRLEKKRIEFMPEISYAISNTDFANDILSKGNSSAININFHTQIYALDLEGDCNCPTFSKQGPSINKGFFLHVTPGVSFHESSFDYTLSPASDKLTYSSRNTVFKAGIGLGLDLGVSDLITITPIISYYFHSSMQWENLPELVTESNVIKNNLSQLQFTLRLGFRPDYGRRRFR